MTDTQRKEKWYKIKERPDHALATLVIFQRTIRNRGSQCGFKMSLMSLRIHKARMELEGAQLRDFRELSDGDLKEDGGGGDGERWTDL